MDLCTVHVHVGCSFSKCTYLLKFSILSPYYISFNDLDINNFVVQFYSFCHYTDPKIIRFGVLYTPTVSNILSACFTYSAAPHVVCCYERFVMLWLPWQPSGKHQYQSSDPMNMSDYLFSQKVIKSGEFLATCRLLVSSTQVFKI